MKNRDRQRRMPERGAAAIEMALTFTLMFSFLWALVAYVLPLIMSQAMNRAVAEATRMAAMVSAVNLEEAEYQTRVNALVFDVLQEQMATIPTGWQQQLNLLDPGNVTFKTHPDCRIERPNCQLGVILVYRNYALNPIIPSLNLPGLPNFPTLPDNLSAESNIVLR